MKSITFKSRFSPTALKAIKWLLVLGAVFVAFPMYLVLAILMAYLAYTNWADLWIYLTTGASSMPVGRNIFMVLLSPVPVVLSLFLLYVIVVKGPKALKVKFHLIPDMEFGWDADKKQFIYKDINRNLRFAGEDVVKWVHTKSEYITQDVLRLNNGEQIVLDSLFNKDVYYFLEEHKTLLNLPTPTSSLVIDPYHDPI